MSRLQCAGTLPCALAAASGSPGTHTGPRTPGSTPPALATSASRREEYRECRGVFPRSLLNVRGKEIPIPLFQGRESPSRGTTLVLASASPHPRHGRRPVRPALGSCAWDPLSAQASSLLCSVELLRSVDRKSVV